MKKAFDQTVRDLKRGVNKKVLKVPSIEQKVLDATSNEPWGPHGSLLADIAHATKNYHEYQMIMSVIWKRINDTGKNWRHVYKALTVLEYLVAHGSERVIDEIREHAYQISTLSDFQYIDSSGRDQGNNVRKKSQSLVVLVNDKERIQEVREKAAANRDKYRSASGGGMYRPGSGGYGDRYDDDRYGDCNGYGRERDWGSRDDDRSSRYGDSYNREGDRYSRDSEDRHSRDGYRDDDYRGRSQSIDDYRYGSRSRSADRDRDRPSYEDDGQYSSRGSAAKADDHSQDGGSVGKRLDRKYSEQNLGAPPSYEEAVGPARSPTYSERDGESSIAPAPKASSPSGDSPQGATATATSAATTAPSVAPASPSAPVSTQATTEYNKEADVDGFDEFDPRGSFSAAAATSNITVSATSNGSAPPSSNAEMDLLGSLSDSFALALVPTSEPTTSLENNAPASFSAGPTFAAASSASTVSNQPFDDPFGDGPFRAITTTDTVPATQQITTAANTVNTNSGPTLDVPQPVPQKPAAEFGGNFYEETSLTSGTPPVSNTPELSIPNQEIDILADILPPSTSSSFASTQNGFPATATQPVSNASFPLQTNQTIAQPGLPSQNSFQPQINQPPAGFPTQHGLSPLQSSFPLQSAESASEAGFLAQPTSVPFPVQGGQASQMGYYSQTGQPSSVAGFPSQMGGSPHAAGLQNPQMGGSPHAAGLQNPLGAQSNTPNPNFYGAYQSQLASSIPGGGQMVPTGPSGPIAQPNFLSQSGPTVNAAPQIPGAQVSQLRPGSPLAPVSMMPTASTGSTAIVPQPSKDKFETKSTVWADTLSRGLVNLNISGPKTNPLADIGVDFDAINRREKRMEKPTTAAVTSTVNMGKAMGSGSGIGRAGAGALRPPPNPMMGSGMNMAMGGGPGPGMSMGGYGANQPMMGRGMGVGMNMSGNMGMGMNMSGNMGMGMNMGMNQGIHMQQQQAGFPQPGGYNPMMGPGNYGQQPYGGGYR